MDFLVKIEITNLLNLGINHYYYFNYAGLNYLITKIILKIMTTL